MWFKQVQKTFEDVFTDKIWVTIDFYFSSFAAPVLNYCSKILAQNRFMLINYFLYSRKCMYAYFFTKLYLLIKSYRWTWHKESNISQLQVFRFLEIKYMTCTLNDKFQTDANKWYEVLSCFNSLIALHLYNHLAAALLANEWKRYTKTRKLW